MRTGGTKEDIGKCDECGILNVPMMVFGKTDEESCTHEVCGACLQTACAKLAMRNHDTREKSNPKWIHEDAARNAALAWAKVIKGGAWINALNSLSKFLENCECIIAKNAIFNSASVPLSDLPMLESCFYYLNKAWQEAGRPQTPWP